MRSNIYILWLGLAFSAGSCNNRNAVITETSNGQTDSTSAELVEDQPEFYNGIVRDMTKTEGCGFMIEIDASGGQQLLEPNFLDDKYKVDGTPIHFSFTDSRRSTTCTLPAKPITINEIIE